MRTPARKQLAHAKRVQRKAAQRRVEIQSRRRGHKTLPKQDRMLSLYQRYINSAKNLIPLWLMQQHEEQVA